MSVWITTVPREDATGVLADAYEWQAKRAGAPSEFTQLGSLYPDLVMERLRFYKTVEAAPSALTPMERYLAALVVSEVNGTPHCSSGLRRKVAFLGLDAHVAESLIADAAHPATGDHRWDVVLGYAVKLTLRPAEMVAEDVDALRAVGLADLDILDLNNIVAYYNYTNRVANGLGLFNAIPEHDDVFALLPS